jgi:hypothetical protein
MLAGYESDTQTLGDVRLCAQRQALTLVVYTAHGSMLQFSSRRRQNGSGCRASERLRIVSEAISCRATVAESRFPNEVPSAYTLESAYRRQRETLDSLQSRR